MYKTKTEEALAAALVTFVVDQISQMMAVQKKRSSFLGADGEPFMIVLKI